MTTSCLPFSTRSSLDSHSPSGRQAAHSRGRVCSHALSAHAATVRHATKRLTCHNDMEMCDVGVPVVIFSIFSMILASSTCGKQQQAQRESAAAARLAARTNRGQHDPCDGTPAACWQVKETHRVCGCGCPLHVRDLLPRILGQQLTHLHRGCGSPVREIGAWRAMGLAASSLEQSSTDRCA